MGEASKGYAIKVKGEIDMRTVFDTERGAKGNFMYRHGVRVADDWSDKKIDDLFEYVSELTDAELVAIDVTEASDAADQ